MKEIYYYTYLSVSFLISNNYFQSECSGLAEPYVAPSTKLILITVESFKLNTIGCKAVDLLYCSGKFSILDEASSSKIWAQTVTRWQSVLERQK